MAFVWEENSGEQVRNASQRAMDAQIAELEQTMERYNREADRLEREARRIESTLPIMRSETSFTTMWDMHGPFTVSRTVQVEDVAATSALRTQASTLRAEAQTIREAGGKLAVAGRVLDQRIASTNALFRELFELTRQADAASAVRIREIKNQIETYTHKIRAIQNSLSEWESTEERHFLRAIIDASRQRRLVGLDTHAEAWNYFREILNLPADEITEQQYANLAWFLILQDTPQDQERFLNYLADPIDVPQLHTVNPHNDVPFVVCPLKVAGIQRHIYAGTFVLLIRQFQLIEDGTPLYDATIRLLTEERRTLMQRHALLVVAGELGTRSNGEWGWEQDDPNRPIRRALFAEPNSQGPFTITQNTGRNIRGETVSDGITLSVQHGTIAVIGDEPFATAHFNRVDRANFMGNNTIYISDGLAPPEASRLMGDLQFEIVYARHSSFNTVSYIASQVMDKVRAAAIAVAWKKYFPIAGATAALYGLEILLKVSPAESKAESLRQDIMNMRDAYLFGWYTYHFELDTILISEEGRAWQALSWPTFNSYASIHAFNHITLQNFTWAEFMQNPSVAFEIYKDEDFRHDIDDFRHRITRLSGITPFNSPFTQVTSVESPISFDTVR